MSSTKPAIPRTSTNTGNAFYLVPALALFFGLFLPMLLSSFDCDLLLILLLPVLLLLGRSIFIVNPAERGVIVDFFSGEPRILEKGVHWTGSLRHYRQGPRGSNWAKFGKFPEVGSRVHIDPRPTQVHTKDGIAATADVSLECVVREWGALSMLKDGGCIHSRACTTVNQWISEQLSQLSADQCTYGHLNQFLNSPERIDALNTMLASGFTYLAAHRIVIDANGIQLSHAWLAQREEINQKRQQLSEREKVIERELQIQRLERTKQQEAVDFDLASQSKQVQHEAEANKLIARSETETQYARACSELKALKEKTEYEDARESKRVMQALENGLSAEQYCKIAIARVHFETMAKSGGAKYLSVPPGVLGLGAARLDDI